MRLDVVGPLYQKPMNDILNQLSRSSWISLYLSAHVSLIITSLISTPYRGAERKIWVGGQKNVSTKLGVYLLPPIPKHTINTFINLCHVVKTKINKKRPGLACFYKKWGIPNWSIDLGQLRWDERLSNRCDTLWSCQQNYLLSIEIVLD